MDETPSPRGSTGLLVVATTADGGPVPASGAPHPMLARRRAAQRAAALAT
jgi:hypothetical protein